MGRVACNIISEGRGYSSEIDSPAQLMADNYASIVNSALQTQSFGGEPDEQEEPKTTV